MNKNIKDYTFTIICNKLNLFINWVLLLPHNTFIICLGLLTSFYFTRLDSGGLFILHNKLAFDFLIVIKKIQNGFKNRGLLNY